MEQNLRNLRIKIMFLYSGWTLIWSRTDRGFHRNFKSGISIFVIDSFRESCPELTTWTYFDFSQWIFFKCFTEFRDQNICRYSKRAWTCHLLCKRPGYSHSTSKTHVRGRIFKLSPIHSSVIFRFPEFAEFTEFNESSAPFRKTSNIPLCAQQTVLDLNVSYRFQNRS